MEKKKETVLITGATGSVGSAMTEVFVKSNTRVILAVRNIKKGDEFKQRLSKKYPISDIVVTKMDMTDLKEVRSSIKSILNSEKIDMLIHSVATFSSGKIIMSNGFEEMFSINYLAYAALLDEMVKNKADASLLRVVSITPPPYGEISFNDFGKSLSNNPLGIFSKVALYKVILTYALAEKYSAKGIRAIAYHPGFVKNMMVTKMPGFMGAMLRLMQPLASNGIKAAEVLKELVASPDAFTVNGAYYKMQKKQNVRPYLYSNEIQSKLWDRTQELIK